MSCCQLASSLRACFVVVFSGFKTDIEMKTPQRKSTGQIIWICWRQTGKILIPRLKNKAIPIASNLPQNKAAHQLSLTVSRQEFPSEHSMPNKQTIYRPKRCLHETSRLCP